jgi:hypothetical protein
MVVEYCTPYINITIFYKRQISPHYWNMGLYYREQMKSEPEPPNLKRKIKMQVLGIQNTYGHHQL